MNRRKFIRSTAGAVAAGGIASLPGSGQEVRKPAQVTNYTLPRQGPKPIARGKKAVASSSHPLVTEAMIDVMKGGGNAMDAAVAGALMSATVEPEMTNHGGTVTFLGWDAKTAKAYQLESTGTLPSGLPAFRPVPSGTGGFIAPPGRPSAMASIPGFIPGLAAVHERFGTKSWSYLCEHAIKWAEEGHQVSSFEFGVMDSRPR
jgi:gamma-glutamyltranspeptidase/glutathione hydrolase